MTRYIDADKIKYRYLPIPAIGDFFVTKADVDAIPTADVQEIKHGKWNYIRHYGETVGDAERSYIKQTFYYQCSECSRQINFEVYDMDKNCALLYANRRFPYCHCGARMDGGDNETD